MSKNYEDMNAIELFFYYLDLERNRLIDIVESYTKKCGIAIDECISYAFAEEYGIHEEGYFGTNGVKIVIQEPLVEKEKEEIYSLKTFYKCVFEYYENNKNYYTVQEQNVIALKFKEFEYLLCNQENEFLEIREPL